MKRMILPLVLIFTVATSSFAQLTRMEQAIQSARDGSEPAYLEPLITKLNHKLTRFITNQGIRSLPHKIAIFHAMHALQWFIFCEISEGAKGAVSQHDYRAGIAVEKVAYASGWGNAMIALSKHMAMPSDTLLVVVADLIKEVIRRVAWTEALEATLDCRDVVEAARVAYRVAESVGLEILVEHFDELMWPTYQYALLTWHTKERRIRNIDEETVDRLRQLPLEVRVFLAPCLRHFGLTKSVAVPGNLRGIAIPIPYFQTDYPFLGNN